MGRDGSGAAASDEAAARGGTKTGPGGRGSSLRVGILISAGLHLFLLATAAIERRPATLPFSHETEVEPAVIALEVAALNEDPAFQVAAPPAEVLASTLAQKQRPSSARHRPARVRTSPVAVAPRDLSAQTVVPSPRTLQPAPAAPFEADDDDEGDDMGPPAPVDEQVPEGPAHIAASVATALRLYDHFPRIPEPLRHQAAEHAMMVDVCVSERGLVSQVSISPTGVELLERTLREAVQTWRYRPLVVKGTARPFCHMLRVIYRTGSV